MMKIHELKTTDIQFQRIWDNKKLFELRKDDRGFLEGDVLHLKEINSDLDYTGRECLAEVRMVLRNYAGLQPEYCIMSIEPLLKQDVRELFE